jgi:hypothetical protein
VRGTISGMSVEFPRKVDTFAKKLEASPYDQSEDPKLLQFEGDGTHTVRELGAAFFSEETPDFKDVETSAKETKRLFDELRDTYNIDAPVRFVVAQGTDHEKKLYVITDHVRDVTKDQNFDRAAFAEKYRELCSNVMRYFEDKYGSGDNFLWDIIPRLNGRDQYKYGKVGNETSDGFQLIDTDPHFTNSKIKLRQQLLGYLTTLRKGFADDAEMRPIYDRCVALIKAVDEDPRARP